MSQVTRKRRAGASAEKLTKRAKRAVPWRPVPLTATQTRIRLVWTHKHGRLHRKLFHAVVREVCSYIEDPLVIELWENLVGFFDTKTNSWERYVSLEEYGLKCSYASYSRLDVRSLFASGIMTGPGLRSLCYVFRFGSEGFSLQKMPQMKVSRQMAGLLHYRSKVYIFGGVRVKRALPLAVTSFSRSVEVLDLAPLGEWQKVPHRMSCRRTRITPCEWGGKAYLCGGYPRYDKAMTCIEVFCLSSLRFADPLYVPLPLEQSVISFVLDDELVLVANSMVARQSLSDVLAVSRLEREPNLSGCAARGAPIVCGEFLYWTYGRSCVRVKYTESPMRVDTFKMIEKGKCHT